MNFNGGRSACTGGLAGQPLHAYRTYFIPVRSETKTRKIRVSDNSRVVIVGREGVRVEVVQQLAAWAVANPGCFIAHDVVPVVNSVQSSGAMFGRAVRATIQRGKLPYWIRFGGDAHE